MKITILSENTTSEKAPAGIQSEHGLSLYIEAHGKKVLFDTGRSDLFLHNAEKMGIHIAEADYLIISHGHIDHGGGLKHFCKHNTKAPIFIHKHAAGKFYSKLFDFLPFYIGLEHNTLNEYAHRISWVERNTEIIPGIYLSTGFPADFPPPGSNRFLYVKQKNGLQNDSFNHEVNLMIREENGDVLFTACSHSGIVNMIRAYRETYPQPLLKAVLGGFHLHSPLNRKNEDPAYICRLAQTLKEIPATFYTGHCTGNENYKKIKAVLGSQIEQFGSGAVLEL